MKKIKDMLNYGREQSDKMALAQLTVGQIVCNSLTVNHYFQIGGFVATYDKVSDLKPGSVVMTLEGKK